MIDVYLLLASKEGYEVGFLKKFSWPTVPRLEEEVWVEQGSSSFGASYSGKVTKVDHVFWKGIVVTVTVEDFTPDLQADHLTRLGWVKGELYGLPFERT